MNVESLDDVRATSEGRVTCRCQVLGVCETYGMPSTHTQVIAYLFGVHFMTVAMQRAQITSSIPTFRILQGRLEFMALLTSVLLTGYARVYLGYHTLLQVCLGGIVGILFGSSWRWMSVQISRKHSSRLQRSWLCSTLGIKFNRTELSSAKISD